MENIIDELKVMLEKRININVDENNLTVSLNFRGELITREEIGEENEIREMFKIIGGLTEEVDIDIKIDEDSQQIKIKFKKRNDMEHINRILENLWERAAELLNKALLGDFTALKDLGDFED
ncbi:MAG: hypothetical protein ACFFG0_34090 [Candidatus Thorarchaeota archaeon]